MFGITDLGLFVAGTIAIVLLPGPNSLYVLTVAARNGIRAGYAGALRAYYAVELPVGAIRDSSTKVGDSLLFEDEDEALFLMAA